ncbi:MAG TPA: sigma factor-like helix-turn-helix DNA-binding protein [Beijerinckia sp.]|nr:sigma factor-like helix-turn-helix DNA-binding protein [Beijerinckia sp.]
MNARDGLNLWTPRLRRYARALVSGSPAPSESADDLVHRTLLRSLEAGSFGSNSDLGLHLYALLTQLHREALQTGVLGAHAALEGESRYARGPAALEKKFSLPSHRDELTAALASMKLEDREALLLVTLEGLSYAQVSRILRISRAVVIIRLARARLALSQADLTQPTKPRRPSYLRLVK